MLKLRETYWVKKTPTFDGINGDMIYYEATGEEFFVPPNNNTNHVVF